MLRIRRRFALVLCAVFVAIFLAVYFLINYAAPAEDNKKPNFMNLETAEALKQKMDIPSLGESNKLDNYVGEKPQRQTERFFKKSSNLEQPKVDLGDSVKMDDNMISENKDDTCEFDPQQVPQPDIQVGDIECSAKRNIFPTNTINL